MTVLFAGGEVTSFNNFGAVERSSDYNTPARLSLGVNVGQWIETVPFSPITGDLWLHFDAVHTAITQAKSLVEFKNSAGTTLMRIIGGGKVQAYNGSAYVDVATIPYADAAMPITTLDMRVRNGASGFVEIYIAGQFVGRYSANLSAFTNVDRVRFSSSGAGLSSYSQIIVATEETIGWRLATLVPNAAGSYAAWTGGFADINEAIVNDANYISSRIEGETETWKTTTVDPADLSPIKAVVLSARARRSSDGPQNMNAIVRIGSVDYARTVGALELGFGPTQAIYETNPATSATWTPAQVNASEFGVKSVI